MLNEPDAANADLLIDQVARMDPSDQSKLTVNAGDAPDAVKLNLRRASVRGAYLRQDDAWRDLTTGNLDLEPAMLALEHTLGTPPMDVTARLDELSNEVGDRLAGDRAFDVGLTVLGDVLGKVHNLRGNESSYYLPRNNYLSGVLSSGRGIPISLCTVAILVGRRLELPVFGIGAPGHFLGFYGDADLQLGTYFDPFDGFRRLNAGEIRGLLAPFSHTVSASDLRPVNDREIMIRVLNNASGAYRRIGEYEHATNLERWRQVLLDNSA